MKTDIIARMEAMQQRFGGKTEYKSRNSHSTAVVTIIDETPKTFVVRYDDGSTLRVHKDNFERDWEPNSRHWITELYERHEHFGSFPSVLQSSENDRRLQLQDRDPRKAIGDYYDGVVPRSDNGTLDYLSEEQESE